MVSYSIYSGPVHNAKAGVLNRSCFRGARKVPKMKFSNRAIWVKKIKKLCAKACIYDYHLTLIRFSIIKIPVYGTRYPDLFIFVKKKNVDENASHRVR